jgi:hypothetical protein
MSAEDQAFAEERIRVLREKGNTLETSEEK